MLSNPSPSVLTIYNRFGKRIGEPIVQILRGWTRNAYNKAEFSLSVTDSVNCRESVLRYGNLVTIEHPDLPIWGGVIDTPRSWGNKGFVDVTAYSAEYILSFRRAMTAGQITGTPGQVFNQLIQFANLDYPTLIYPGVISSEGDSVARQLSQKNCYDAAVDLAKNTGGFFEVVPVVSAHGELSFQANWYEQNENRDVSGLVLEEGVNVELSGDSLLREQGAIINDVVAEGNSGGTVKPQGSWISDKSIALYGNRQGLESYNTKDTGDLTSMARVFVRANAYPAQTFTLAALEQTKEDTGESLVFRQLRLGRIYPVELMTVGFAGDYEFGVSAHVQLMSMSYEDKIPNRVSLVCEEV